MSVTILGLKELQRELDKLEAAELDRTLQKGMDAGAKFLKPRVKDAAPRGKTGNLKRSISARKARKNRPAAVVTPRPKIAFYRHMVIGGTKPHKIRFPDQKAAGVPKSDGNIDHPGAHANPFIERTAEQYEDAALAVAMRTISAELP